jgi:serine/threonine-protein kinase
MNSDDMLDHADSARSADSSYARRQVASTSTESATSIAEREVSTDQTVISTSPPLELQPAGKGFNPRELGQMLEGQQLDHVLLEQFVGGGGMGAVFRAWDTSLYRTVAVKVLSTYQAGDVESERRFQTEARSAARLDHPNIARVHYVGEDRGIRYIVFEYIDGTNVRDLVNANGPLPLAEAVNFTLQIAGALTHAWEREVVHRDIKPSNILITQDGLAKLVDMGLARLEQLDGPENDETATGVTLGTFDYISPEQARNPREADTRSDIYSLGCTLFFMLTGRPPFADGSVLQKLLLHQSEAPPDVRALRSEVPEPLAGIVATMLAKRPEDRFQNPTELAAALHGCLDQLGLPTLPHVLTHYRSPTPGLPHWWRRHVPWLIPAVVLLAGVLVLGLKWHQSTPLPQFPELQIPATIAPTGQSASQAGSMENVGLPTQ